MKYTLFFICIISLLLSCSSTKNIQFTTAVKAPDYRNSDDWASLPSKKDPADLVPVSSLKNEQETAKVDVFFVHPTTFTKGNPWNVGSDNQEINDKTDNSTIKLQASAFNGSGRSSAPRYRQANLKAFY